MAFTPKGAPEQKRKAAEENTLNQQTLEASWQVVYSAHARERESEGKLP